MNLTKLLKFEYIYRNKLISDFAEVQQQYPGHTLWIKQPRRSGTRRLAGSTIIAVGATYGQNSSNKPEP
jgi:hypothetical protein